MKQYIEADVMFDTFGNMTPIAIWFNDKRYDVDRVTDQQNLAAMIGGDFGVRYTCRINGKERYIWYSSFSKTWFVEYK